MWVQVDDGNGGKKWINDKAVKSAPLLSAPLAVKIPPICAPIVKSVPTLSRPIYTPPITFRPTVRSEFAPNAKPEDLTDTPCTVPGCPRIALVNGQCGTHYSKVPLYRPNSAPTILPFENGYTAIDCSQDSA